MPVVDSLLNARAGSAAVPSTSASSASLPPFPLRSSESVISVLRSSSVVFAHELVMVVAVTTGLPAGRLYVPEALRGMLSPSEGHRPGGGRSTEQVIQACFERHHIVA